MSLLDAIFRTVLEVSWRSSWLVLAVFALWAVFRGRLSARIIFWAWIAVAIRLLLPIAFPASWSPFNIAPFSHRAGPDLRVGPGLGAAGESAAEPRSSATSRAASLLADQIPSQEKLTLGQWAALIWCAGVVVLLAARIFAYSCFIRALQRSRAATGSEMARTIAEEVERMGFSRIKVGVTDVVPAPALHGIFRPQLLIPPEFFEKLTPRELRHTLAHELAHNQRRDLVAQVLIRAAVIVHWFNPLAWLVARVARGDCELACDEFVLQRLQAAERESYGATLLKIIRLANCGAPPPLGLGVVESKQQIKRRIQMIIAQPSPTLARTLLGGALFAFAIGASLTRETLAQPMPSVSESRAPLPVRPLPASARFKYDPANDGLGTLFPTGIVATIGDKTITVEDVRREIKPLISSIDRDARDQEEFNTKVNMLRNSVVKDLIGRVLLIKEFHLPKDTGETKHIPSEYVDNRIADELKERFNNDREQFLAYLQARGLAMNDYRRQVEEDIIFHYMEGQERKLRGDPSGSRAKSDEQGPQVRLRLIQLTRAAGETDAALMDKANVILARFRNGETFEALAREFSQDARRDKGGDWGWQRPSNLKADYSEQLFALKKGEVSAPIVTADGCFLLFAEDRK